MRMVLGLVRPTAGSATVLGMPYASIERPATAVGAVLEVQSFHPLRTARNHLRVLAAASGVPDARVDEVLALVDLTDAADRRAGGYSLGMRQRLGLAGALLGDPRVLILDEPANGLDPQGIRWLREFLRQFAANGNAVLVSSHLLSEMAQMADEVIVIDRGRLVRQGSLADLTAGHSSLHVAAVDRDALLEVLIGDGLEPRVEGDGYVVTGTDAGRRRRDRRRRGHRAHAPERTGSHPRGRVPRADRRSGTMRDQIRSEMRKLRTTRSAWGLFAAAIALAGLAAWAMVASMHFGPAVALTTLPGFAEMMILVPILVAVLGIRSYTDEARHGSIVPTLLATPNRRRVIAGKLVVLAGAAAVFAIAASLTVAIVSGALLVADGVAISVSLAALAVLLAKAIAICALWAAIGLGMGVTVTHQVAAIVGTILWVLVAEGLVEMLSAPVARFLPAARDGVDARDRRDRRVAGGAARRRGHC